ncbi:hypothetical protein [Endozoicomonas sp. SCSIO W0465]|uniref:hypothetical protein n=1 Tax=Endozoicomonas sp. SCSIO W0465 TaxID=2918516 RepID=UPI002074AEDE|nr:hypothetical protein [Endozoicomonas sp. SCSIO W0465]USE36399.1 hypothetical protein MJO57_31000 [Endozoicomonas sp. SCSIO W0465]
MTAYSRIEAKLADEDHCPCLNCGWRDYCQQQRAACGRFALYVESGENSSFPRLSDRQIRRLRSGKSRSELDSFYWAYPTRAIYYKVFAAELKDDVLALCREMTVTEAAFVLKIDRRYLARKLKAWQKASDPQRA